MMEIVHDCPTEKVKATMNCSGLDEFYGKESPPGEDVNVEELWGQRDGKNV